MKVRLLQVLASERILGQRSAIAPAVPRLLSIEASHVEEEFSKSSAGVKQNDKYNCVICDFVLRQKLELRRHIEKHTRAKSHVCTLCEHKHINMVRRGAHDKRVHMEIKVKNTMTKDTKEISCEDTTEE